MQFNALNFELDVNKDILNNKADFVKIIPNLIKEPQYFKNISDINKKGPPSYN